MSDNYRREYMRVSLETADDLRTIATSASLQALSTLTLPEIGAAVEAVARVIPAGNVPAMILNGLARLSDRRPSPENVRRDVNLLFKGVEAALDKAVYGAFFAGPAAVIWGYQNLLKLTGKEPEASFAEGLWQFYADHALREDTSRFTVETNGFDTVLGHHQIELAPANRVTAWIMASIHCLHQYHDWLANEWRERVYISILQEVVQATPPAEPLARLHRQWARRRPYGRGPDAAPDENYARYRRRKFDHFLRQALDQLAEERRFTWNQRVQEAKEQLPAYQQQMTILAYLEAGAYGETRQAIALQDACIGLIYQGRYYLIPVCQPGSDLPATAASVQAQVMAIMRQPTGAAAMHLSSLAGLRRQEWAKLRPGLNQTLLASLERLRLAPILVNADQQSPHRPLSELRQAERGVGDQPLTIFDAQKCFVFDLSHIFFDGLWSVALAELLTREALAWAVYLQGRTTPAEAEPSLIVKPLLLPFEQRELLFVQQAERVAVEVSVETTAVQLKPMLALRKLFKMRNDLLALTVNDLLVLYRTIHAVTYQPDPELVAVLEAFLEDPRLEAAASQALAALQPAAHTPALMIPLDATRKEPKERIYPLVFEAPLHELDLLDLHRRTMAALALYEQAPVNRRVNAYAKFDRWQRRYLATLAGFGQVLTRAKEIAIHGESASQGAIKLLAHVPAPLQHLFEQLPNRFDVINELIKGREVLTNVGAVAPGSTLARFNAAKDDNGSKALAWGVLTDAGGTVHISLRDFRPHVAALVAAGRGEVARRMAQHYVDSYARGLNSMIDDLSRITRATSGD